MREILNKNKSGLIFGTFAAFMHVIWSVLVALGIAQWWINFIISLHFLNVGVVMQPFALGTALILVVLTFAVGYIIGFIFAAICNFYNKK